MFDKERVRLLYLFGMDAAIWYCVPSAFLFVYVSRYSVPAEAVLPHLRLVALTLLGLALFRMALSRLIHGRAAARLVTSIVASTLLATMLLYYGLVLIGLQSWGRVISWDLMTSYAAQVSELAETLEISVPFAISVFGLTYLGLLAVTWAYLKQFDWAPFLARRMSASLCAFSLLSGCAVGASEVYNFSAAPWTKESEPVSLTFFPFEAERNVQGHAIDRLSAARLDRMEDTVRASYGPNSGVDRKNVILIVVDALRPDHMGVYGYGRDTTPTLNRLAQAGMIRIAPNVHASCASSACGLFSLASSKFVHQFSKRPFTLPEVLKRHGYRIHMLLSGDHTSFYDLKAIYGDVDSYFDGHAARRLSYMNDDRLILEQFAAFPSWDGVPVMIQLHLMSTHLLGKRHPTSIKFSPWATYVLSGIGGTGDAGRPSERTTNFYDNGVVQADEIIRDLLEILRRKGYLDNAVVAITADHGELLGEHGLFQHAHSVREEVLRIPFVLISYGYKPVRSIDNQSLASQVDIAPTILAELGIPRPATWSGVPLQESVVRNFTYFRERFDGGLIDHRDPGHLWKYWVNSETGEEYAFNLSMDPRETLNAISEVPLDHRLEWRLRLPVTRYYPALLPVTGITRGNSGSSPR